MFQKAFLLLIMTVSLSAQAQNLLKERIWKVSPRKKSIYFEKGVFHFPGHANPARLNAVRHSYTQRLGYERVVLDFNTPNLPKVYGFIDRSQNKVYVNLIGTQLKPSVGSFGKSKFVKSLNFYPIDNTALSLELALKNPSSVDVFYLENPGRLVLDIRR